MTPPKPSDENRNLLCEAVCWVRTLCAGRKLRPGPCWRLNHHHLHYSSQHQNRSWQCSDALVLQRGQVQSIELLSDQKYNITKQST